MKVTARMVDALRAVVEFLESRGYPPTAAEVGEAMGVSAARAHQLLGRLVEAGRLERDDGVSRGLRLPRS